VLRSASRLELLLGAKAVAVVAAWGEVWGVVAVLEADRTMRPGTSATLCLLVVATDRMMELLSP